MSEYDDAADEPTAAEKAALDQPFGAAHRPCRCGPRRCPTAATSESAESAADGPADLAAAARLLGADGSESFGDAADDGDLDLTALGSSEGLPEPQLADRRVRRGQRGRRR